MSPSLFDTTEFTRWFRQAENALESAKVDKEKGFFNWACFKAQQAAEYALKGLLRGSGKPAMGHSCYVLSNQLKDIGFVAAKKIESRCRLLDRYYIPTRYPDAFNEASPYEFFDRGTALQAIKSSQEVLKFVRNQFDSIEKSS